MTRPSPCLFRSLRVLAWGVLASSMALAQLDPRLQASKTDFLDLYQQSTNAQPKPEILSIFDFSRSMASLMFHPLFRNDDALNQDDDSRVLSIALSSSAAEASRYGLQIKANNACYSMANTISITVDTSGNATPIFPAANTLTCVSTGLVYPFSVTAKTAALTFANVILMPEAGFVATAAHPYPNYFVSAALSSNTTTAPYLITHADKSTTPLPTLELSPAQPSGGYTAGTVVTATTYLLHPPVEGDLAAKKTLTWQRVTNLDPVTGATISGFTSATNLTGTMTTLDAAAGFYKSEVTFTVPSSVATPNDPVQFGDFYVQKVNGVSVSAPNYGSPWKSGDVLTFAAYLSTPGTATKILWSNPFWLSGLICTVPTFTPVASPASLTDPSNPWTANWTIPSPCPVAAPKLLLSLDPRAGTSPVPGMTYLTEAWSGTPAILIKPSGAVVTAADADAAIGSSLENASLGRAHVLNWIRAASHVRLSAVVDSKTRTIDVPIPWKVFDPTSTSNPLASTTVLDQQLKGGVTYGSGLQIEVDQAYKHLTQSGGIFAGGAVVPASPASLNGVYLYGVTYRPAYLSWLFNAKYQSSDASKANYTTESSLVGKFVVFDAVDKSIVGGQNLVSWGQGFGPTDVWGTVLVPQYAADGTYSGINSDEASNYRIPALTRLQAVKKAAIQAWIAHQADAYWAFRFLDPTGEAGSGTVTTLSNDSTTLGAASNLALAATNAAKPGMVVTGTYSGWSVINNTATQGPNATSGNSVNGMTFISHLFASGGTPTTYAMARSLAQFTDPGSVFNAIEGTDVSQCGSAYLLLITDGADDNAQGSLNANTASPYFTTGSDGTLALDAAGGNRAIIADKTSIDRGGSSWNTFTLAGIGAHLADPALGVVNVDYLAAPDPGASSKTGLPSTFLPLAIKKRNGITLNQDRRVLTMTLGLSLGGKYTDSNSPKRNLFLTAAAGDPGITSGPLSGFQPFDPSRDWLVDPRDPSGYPTVGKRKDGAVFFFDATNSDKLITAMDYLFRVATGSLGNQATTSPSLPFVGASLGNQIYVGRFLPPSSGGVLWSGDLLMFSTKEENGSLSILDKKSGAVASTLDDTTAQWSAAVALRAGPVGTKRKLLTRIPGGDALKPFTASAADLDFNHAVTGLKNFVATDIADLATKQLIIHHAAGGDITNLDSGTSLPKTNRSNIMGDIINSAPAAIEYNWSEVKGSLSAYSTLSAFGGSRFRLVLVGTNQGWLHAFGEVTKTDATSGLVTGAVQELWSFLPTDFLAKLSYLKDNSNAHRFMVDGTPVVYHLDLPPSGGWRGNGVVDSNERAVAIFGLRKGGRSYYALDIHDPFNPTLKWSLVPDEATSLTAERNATGLSLATVQSLLAKAGFSTSTPALGRIQDASNILRDAVFLGGGGSNAETEANFSNTKLGRFVLALDAYSGKILAAADLTEASPGGGTVGPVAAGVVPFEFILNSGMAQRAYFTDYTGGLWAWGATATVPSETTNASLTSFKGFRIDSAKLTDWQIRKVYQDTNETKGARYTTLPAPFRVGSYPIRAATGTAVPAAVGIAMVSGDRNNPLDRAYNLTTNPSPINHQLTVVFDRQDRTSALGQDRTPPLGSFDLRDFTQNNASKSSAPGCTDSLFRTITPGCDDYYLAPGSGTPAYGYYVTFPAADASTGFVPKGINPPLVVAGSLFYSYFTPETANPCTGGTGTTKSWLIADVMNPIVDDARSGLTVTSGLKGTWAGVASDFLAVGTRSVVQGGMRQISAATSSAPAITALALTTTSTAGMERYPKARVWRTVH